LSGGEETNLPLYPYRCKECGHHFEKIQKFGAKPEKVCPKCGGVLERPLTAPGLKFKGAGWYVNDYAAKGGSSKSGSSATESAAAEKKTGSEAKTESKSASSGESASANSTTSAPAKASGTAAK
jgi:putative FmdB family regulatory protein